VTSRHDNGNLSKLAKPANKKYRIPVSDLIVHGYGGHSFWADLFRKQLQQKKKAKTTSDSDKDDSRIPMRPTFLKSGGGSSGRKNCKRQKIDGRSKFSPSTKPSSVPLVPVPCLPM